MMGQTRVDIAPWVRHKVGLPSDDRAVTDAKVFMDINAGLREMAQDYDWPWLYDETTISVASGDTTAPLPAGLVRPAWASIDDMPLDYVQYRRLQRYSQMSGFPAFFSTFKGNLILHPTANSDQEVKLVYIRGEQYLNDDSDEVLCPDELIEIVYTYAAIQTATRLKDAVLRQSLRDELTDWKRRAADNAKPAKGTFAPQVGRDWI